MLLPPLRTRFCIFPLLPPRWKTSCVVLVLKTVYPRETNHFRPVFLLFPLDEESGGDQQPPFSGEHAAGPLLFAYHPGVGVDDAIHRITFWQDHFNSCRVLEAVWLHGQWTTSSKDHSTWGFRSVRLKWWYAASGALRGWSSVPSSLPSILRTSDTTPQNAISRSSLMIQSNTYFIWCDLTTCSLTPVKCSLTA